MLQETDMKRIQKIIDGSSSLGEKLSRLVIQTLKWTYSKTLFVILGILLSVGFFTLGAIGRRK